MRVALGAMMTAAFVAGSGAALAQDLCTNIRLSVAEQIECRGRLTNALGDGDRTRIQQEFEDRIRRASDQLITPPILRSPPPTTTSAVPSTGRPAIPSAPIAPQAPALPGSSRPSPPPGAIAEPGGAPPSGSAIVPDLTAPDPTSSPLPPISPFPANPAGSFSPAK